MNDQKPAHACVFSLTGTIVEDKTAAVDSTPSEITKFEDAKPWGNVAPSRGDLLFRASPSSIDEIIRQESLNHPLYYIYAHFEGLERTTEANNEGGIVDYIWPIKTQDGSDRHLSVLSYSMSYHKSANYDPHAEPPYSLTNDDFSNVAWNIKYLFHEVESSRKYLGAIVLGLVILIVIIIWRH
jgi:hypothetical protein